LLGTTTIIDSSIIVKFTNELSTQFGINTTYIGTLSQAYCDDISDEYRFVKVGRE